MNESPAFLRVLIDVSYLVAAILFITGLKRLSSPATARSGNLVGALGMLIAIVATLLYQGLHYQWILVGMLLGSAAGLLMARTIPMTDMPQMVGILNGFGGGASVAVAVAEYLRYADQTFDVELTIVLSVIIGAVTFSGSLIAAGKLHAVLPSRAITFPVQNVISGLFFLATLAAGAALIMADQSPATMAMLTGLALLLGVLLVIPIGGADMPVVISLLNSYSGIAGAMTGFVLKNNALIISGALVGASGIILTQIMCRAMNRSIMNVMFGAFGSHTAAEAGAAVGERSVREIDAEDSAILLSYARSVVFVPGYGLAVSQAQHQVRELATALEEKGVEVKYAIHPVAGRMPGHMNVLLAEANVPYDQLFEMEKVNPELDRVDVVVVIGANDVVNPAAREDRNSPIYGMPIIEVDKAKAVIVMKRSMAAGFSGIDNDLFYLDNTRMLFGDAKKMLTRLVEEVKIAD